jgi:CRP/FNR family cyclic AMP-dependent transcriptional regulator
MADAPDTGKLASINRLEALTEPELIAVISAGKHLHLPADWALISESTPADKAYLIVDGEVSVRKAGAEIARLGPGDVIGEIAIVEQKLRTASVVSLTPLEVVHFTRDALEQLLADVPAFGAAMRGTTADRLTSDHEGRDSGPA